MTTIPQVEGSPFFEAHGPTNRDGSANDALGKFGAKVDRANLSFRIPPQTTLVDDGFNTISTRKGTKVKLILDERGIDVSFTPGIVVHVNKHTVGEVYNILGRELDLETDLNVDGKIEDVFVTGVTYSFAGTDSTTNRGVVSDLRVRREADLMKLDRTHDVWSQIILKLDFLLAGTPAAMPGYSVFTDGTPMKTLRAIQENIKKMSTPDNSKFPYATFDSFRASVTFKAVKEIKVGRTKSGIRIPAGRSLTISSSTPHGGSEIEAWFSDDEKQTTPKLGVMYLTCPGGILLQMKDKKGLFHDVISIDSVSIARGGGVSVKSFRVLDVPGKSSVAKTAGTLKKIGETENAVETVMIGALAFSKALLAVGQLVREGNISSNFNLDAENRALDTLSKRGNLGMLVGGITKDKLEQELTAEASEGLAQFFGMLAKEHMPAIKRTLPNFSFKELFGVEPAAFPPAKINARLVK